MDSELSSPSPPDVVAEDEAPLEKTDGGKALDCVGDDVAQRFTAGERSAGSWRAGKAVVQGFVGF